MANPAGPRPQQSPEPPRRPLLASLSMYDWPQARAQSDLLWAAIALHLRAAGLDAPDALTRDRSPEAMWSSPDLVLGQTCGLPYVRGLRGRVALVGTPEYQVPGCRPGWYNSVIVVRSGELCEKLSDFQNRRLAINGASSQSGCQAIMFTVADMSGKGKFFANILTSGGHVQSIEMVANGQADIASIDHVSWRLAKKFTPDAARLRVLGHTSPTPGLPLITASSSNQAAIAKAVASAIAELTDDENPAGLTGLWASRPQDYDLIAERARIGDEILRAHNIR